MNITSLEFENNKFIPAKFTCQGQGVNPTLYITDIPVQAKSLALIIDDPDAPAGNFVHWVLFDLPLINCIKENSVFGKQGRNTLGKFNYIPPCPPSGVHRYFFKIYALDIILGLNVNIDKVDLEKAMKSHILDQAQLIGLYQKK